MMLATLKYLYCNSVEINMELAKDVVYLANEYSILGLKSLCEDFLCERLVVDNLVAIAKLAEEVESDVMRKAVVKLIKKSTEELNKIDDLLEIPKSIFLYCLFKSNAQ